VPATCVVVWRRRGFIAAVDASRVGGGVDRGPAVVGGGAVESPAVPRVDALDVGQPAVVAVRHAYLRRRRQARAATS